MKRIFSLGRFMLFALIVIMTATSCGTQKKTEKTQNPDFQMQEPPQGMPPMMGQNGNPPQGMPPGGMMGGGNFDVKQLKAAISLSDGELVKQDTSIVATESNQSAVLASSKAKISIRNSKIETSGNTTSQESSSFQGLNAGVLGRDESEIKLSRNTIETTGEGANGVFAYGKSVIYSDSDVINCTAGGGHGIMCSGGGTIHATNVDITTAGRNSAAVATDRGSGVITVDKGKILTKGSDSPAFYSTGKLIVSNVDAESTGSEMVVIEGSNLVQITNSKLRCTYPKKWGAMIYQSFSGDAEGADGEFKMENSSFEYTDAASPLFFVTNSTAYITLKNDEIKCASGILLNAASSRWGQSGSNGGVAVLKIDSQKLDGVLNADQNSQIKLSLSNQSVLNGAINGANSAKFVSVVLDENSQWNVTSDSYVTEIKAHFDGDNVLNVTGNNHTVYYNTAKNPDLNGKTYHLQGGGELKAI